MKRLKKNFEESFLHYYNAPSNDSAKTGIAKAGFKVAEHPPYSSDLTPNVCRLFSKLKEYLIGFALEDEQLFI